MISKVFVFHPISANIQNPEAMNAFVSDPLCNSPLPIPSGRSDTQVLVSNILLIEVFSHSVHSEKENARSPSSRFLSKRARDANDSFREEVKKRGPGGDYFSLYDLVLSY